MSQPLVSVIIPTHNRKEMLVRLLKSIFKSRYKRIEIVIVDDASTDGTADMIKKVFSHNKAIRVVKNKVNLFTAGSRNVGTDHANGKYFFYVDDDNVIDKNAITVLVKKFETDEEIGELGLVNYSYSDKHKIQWVYTTRNMYTTKTYMSKKLDEVSHFRMWDSADVPNAFMIRAAVLKRYHISFRTALGIMYEESDVAYRIRSVGYAVRVVRDAKIYHDVGDYLYHFMNDKRRWFVFARNRIIFHSLYSTKAQLLFILIVWIWVFAAYYIYLIVSYSRAHNYSLKQQIQSSMQYLKGNIAGLAFVLRK